MHWYKHSARELMKKLSIMEFADLCSGIDREFGPALLNGRVMHESGSQLSVAEHRGFVRFTVYCVERLPGKILVAVDLGRGNIGKVELPIVDAEKKAA